MLDLESGIANATGKERSYHLKACVEIKTFSSHDHSGKLLSFDQVYFLVEENTEYAKFLMSRNPFNERNFETQKYIEFVAILPGPFNQACRVEWSTPNRFCNKHHFRVMTIGIEEIFINSKTIKDINFEVVPSSEEENYKV